jgi:ubiquinone/menaquinone biosynthesis C-methylase UbiE
MADLEAVVQRYYGDRPLMPRIDDALRAAGVDPEKPSYRDLWPFDQLHSGGIAATRGHAERARIKADMYVLDLGCGLGGASRYLAGECGCRVTAIDLTPNFVEVARILTDRCGLSDRVDIRQANALALPFQAGIFDHVWAYAVTMNIADKEGLAREVARVLKSGGRFSCNEIARGSGGQSFRCRGRPMRCLVSLPVPWQCAPLSRRAACRLSNKSTSPRLGPVRQAGVQ